MPFKAIQNIQPQKKLLNHWNGLNYGLNSYQLNLNSIDTYNLLSESLNFMNFMSHYFLFGLQLKVHFGDRHSEPA